MPLIQTQPTLSNLTEHVLNPWSHPTGTPRQEYLADNPAILVGTLGTTLAASMLLHSRFNSAVNRLKPRRQTWTQMRSGMGVPDSVQLRRTAGDEAHFTPGGVHSVTNWLKARMGRQPGKKDRKAEEVGSVTLAPQLDKPAVMAHELGHASIAAEPWYSPSRLNQSWLRPLTGIPATVGGVLAGAHIGRVVGVHPYFRSPWSAGAAAGLAGGVTGAVTQLPTLINEWQASNRAKKFLENSGMNPQELDANKAALNRAFMTYLGSAAVLPALSAGLRASLVKGAAIRQDVLQAYGKSPEAGRRLQRLYERQGRNSDGSSKLEKKRQPTDTKLKTSIFDKLPWLAGGALGAAGLVEAGRRATFTPEFLKDLNRFSQQQELEDIMGYRAGLDPAQKAFQGVADYAIQGSRVLGHKLWGKVPVKSIIEKARSGPWVPEAMRWTPGSEHHYNAFEKGPLPAAVRVIQELGYGWDPSGVGSVRLPDEQHAGLLSGINRSIGKTTGVANYFNGQAPPPKSWFSEALTPGLLGHQEQVKALRALGPALSADPQVRKDVPGLPELTEVMGRADAKLRKNYGAIVDPILGTNNVMRNTALGLGGAGVLGLGGYGLYRYLKMRAQHAREVEEAKKKRRAQGPSAFPLWMAQNALGSVGIKTAAVNPAYNPAAAPSSFSVRGLLTGMRDSAAKTMQEKAPQFLAAHPTLRGLLGVEIPTLKINLGLAPKGLLTGAGLGAAAGAAGMMLDEPMGEETPEQRAARMRRRWLINPVTGGVLGAIPGFIHDYARMMGAQQMWNQIPQAQRDLMIQAGSQVSAGSQAKING